MTKNAENKIDRILEEAGLDLRNRNLALQIQGMTPETKDTISTAGGRFGKAAKTGLKVGGFAGLGGALGGGLAGGPAGAVAGAASMGTGLGVGSGVGTYLNLRSMANMSPEDVEKYAQEAEKVYGPDYAEAIRKVGSRI